jgi:three-Cys-motif partner protein
MPRPVGDWTKDKLQVLASYLPAYLQATTRATERVYVDGFAGPGTNILRSSAVIAGSPLIALDAKAKNGTTFDRFIFIEKDDDAFAELTDTVSRHPLAKRATLLHGNVNEKLPNVLLQVNRRSPTFVFLDTEGIEPEWRTIESIAAWQTELLINFPFGMAIKRNIGSPKVTNYFGTGEWRSHWDAPGPGRTRRILDFYRGRLQALGYEHMLPNDPLVKARGNRKLYYLVFASKVAIAPGIMKWVTDQPDFRGQMKMQLDDR